MDIFGNSIPLNEMPKTKDLKHGGRIKKRVYLEVWMVLKKDFIVRIVLILKKFNIVENILNVKS